MKGRIRRRALGLARRWPLFVWLMVVWVALWGSPSPANLLGGAAVALAVGVTFPLPPLPTVLRLRPWPLFVLVVRFLADLVVSSFEVAALAWRPRRPGVAVVRTQVATTSEAVLTMVGELTSLVPGTIVLETDSANRAIYLHCLGTDTMQDVETVRRRVRRVDQRVRDAFGTRAHTQTIDEES